MATQSDTTTPFRLLDLPAELRNKVYYWALPPSITPYVCQHNTTHHLTCTFCHTATDLPAPHPAAALLLACRQLHDEALPILRKYTTLTLPVQPWCAIPRVLWSSLYFRNILIAPPPKVGPVDVDALTALFDGVVSRMRVRRSYALLRRLTVHAYEYEALERMMGSLRLTKPVQDVTEAWPDLPVKMEFRVIAVQKDAKKWEGGAEGVELRRKCEERGVEVEMRESGPRPVEVLVGKWCVCAAQAYVEDVKRRLREAPSRVPWREMMRMKEFERKNQKKLEGLEGRDWSGGVETGFCGGG
ncbi:hypothetical protein BU16DRAFT_603005 [Lophium mytilinum]|uniref:F-box domain-containing protein n=1 Tax=Lophium mytilinum TaxID=390894 RepID=A0A6A6R2T0_9PEZI|nr:hypothetical protein BU16DRAFT_603005 [Lophium mytilinum]